MLDGIRNLWPGFQEDLPEFEEQTTWKYYIKDRAVLHGLPIAAITAAASAYLFQAVSEKTGAIFGVVNYITLTSIIEVLYDHFENEIPNAAVIASVGIS